MLISVIRNMLGPSPDDENTIHIHTADLNMEPDASDKTPDEIDIDAEGKDENKVTIPTKKIKVEDEKSDADGPTIYDELVAGYFEEPPSAPALTLNMLEIIQEAIQKPADTEVVEGYDLKITTGDLMHIFKEGEWLEDKNVDFYMKLIEERSKEEGYPSVFAFPCFFYELYVRNEDYNLIEKCSDGVNIFEKDVVFFPVMVSHHWRLIVFSYLDKRLECYDSLARFSNCKRADTDILYKICIYIFTEYEKKYMREGETVEDNFKNDGWGLGIAQEESIPQQSGFSDCGVFVLQMAEYLSRKKELNFTQENVPYFRKRMVYETLSKKLLPTM